MAEFREFVVKKGPRAGQVVKVPIRSKKETAPAGAAAAAVALAADPPVPVLAAVAVIALVGGGVYLWRKAKQAGASLRAAADAHAAAVDRAAGVLP